MERLANVAADSKGGCVHQIPSELWRLMQGRVMGSLASREDGICTRDGGWGETTVDLGGIDERKGRTGLGLREKAERGISLRLHLRGRVSGGDLD